MIPTNYAIFGKRYFIASTTATINTLVGSTISASSGKYNSSVRAGNGKMYYIPDAANKVLEYDPTTGATTLIGTDFGINQGKWSCGILVPNGKIYCLPLNRGKVMVIDVYAGTTTEIGTDYITTTSNNTPGYAKWHGGGLGSDGNVYGIPRGHTQMLKVDTTTDTTSLVGDVLPLYGEKYSYGCFTNGKIYGMPNTYNNVIVYDIASGVTSYISTPFTGSTAYKLAGCIVHTNGNIYTAPNQQSNILAINTTAGTASLITGTSGNGGCILGQNKLIYIIPFGASKLIEFDPVSEVAQPIGTSISLTSHYGGQVYSNGKLYTTPYNDTRIMEIEILVSNTMGSDMLIPSDLSTLAGSNYNRYYNNR